MITSPLFELEREAQVIILRLHGHVGSLSDADVMHELSPLIQDVQDSGASGVVVDFGQLNYFGSNMLEALLNLWKPLMALDRKMALCSVSDIGQEILKVSRLDTLWPIYGSRAEAVAAVRS